MHINLLLESQRNIKPLSLNSYTLRHIYGAQILSNTISNSEILPWVVLVVLIWTVVIRIQLITMTTLSVLSVLKSNDLMIRSVIQFHDYVLSSTRLITIQSIPVSANQCIAILLLPGSNTTAQAIYQCVRYGLLIISIIISEINNCFQNQNPLSDN